MVADAFGEGFDADAEVRDVGVEPGEGEVGARVGAMLVDQGNEFRVTIEGGARDAGVRGNGGDAHPGAGLVQVGQGLFLRATLADRLKNQHHRKTGVNHGRHHNHPPRSTIAPEPEKRPGPYFRPPRRASDAGPLAGGS